MTEVEEGIYKSTGFIYILRYVLDIFLIIIVNLIS